MSATDKFYNGAALRADAEPISPATMGSGFFTETSGKAFGWSAMDKVVHEVDAQKIKGFKEDIDTILVFTGLFSAIMTAFVIESYQSLSEDSTAVVIALLSQIAVQTAAYQLTPNFINSTAPSTFQRPPYNPPLYAVRINVLWFASLTLSLVGASVGILVKQWLREYLAGDYTSSQARLRVRHFRNPALSQWKVFEIAALMPLLLQTALALFLIGLCFFTASVHASIGHTTLPLVAGWGFFLIASLFAPAISSRCPYKTPLFKTVMRRVRRKVHAFRQLCRSHVGRHWQWFLHIAPSAWRELSLESVEEEDIVRDDQEDIDIFVTVDAIQSDEQLLLTMWDAFKQSHLEAEDALYFVSKIIGNRREDGLPGSSSALIDITDLPTQASAVIMELVADLTILLAQELDLRWSRTASSEARWQDWMKGVARMVLTRTLSSIPSRANPSIALCLSREHAQSFFASISNADLMFTFPHAFERLRGALMLMRHDMLHCLDIIARKSLPCHHREQHTTVVQFLKHHTELQTSTHRILDLLLERLTKELSEHESREWEPWLLEEVMAVIDLATLSDRVNTVLKLYLSSELRRWNLFGYFVKSRISVLKAPWDKGREIFAQALEQFGHVFSILDGKDTVACLHVLTYRCFHPAISDMNEAIGLRGTLEALGSRSLSAGILQMLTDMLVGVVSNAFDERAPQDSRENWLGEAHILLLHLTPKSDLFVSSLLKRSPAIRKDVLAASLYRSTAETSGFAQATTKLRSPLTLLARGDDQKVLQELLCMHICKVENHRHPSFYHIVKEHPQASALDLDTVVGLILEQANAPTQDIRLPRKEDLCFMLHVHPHLKLSAGLKHGSKSIDNLISDLLEYRNRPMSLPVIVAACKELGLSVDTAIRQLEGALMFVAPADLLTCLKDLLWHLTGYNATEPPHNDILEFVQAHPEPDKIRGLFEIICHRWIREIGLEPAEGHPNAMAEVRLEPWLFEAMVLVMKYCPKAKEAEIMRSLCLSRGHFGALCRALSMANEDELLSNPTTTLLSILQAFRSSLLSPIGQDRVPVLEGVTSLMQKSFCHHHEDGDDRCKGLRDIFKRHHGISWFILHQIVHVFIQDLAAFAMVKGAICRSDVLEELEFVFVMSPYMSTLHCCVDSMAVFCQLLLLDETCMAVFIQYGTDYLGMGAEVNLSLASHFSRAVPRIDISIWPMVLQSFSELCLKHTGTGGDSSDAQQANQRTDWSPLGVLHLLLRLVRTAQNHVIRESVLLQLCHTCHEIVLHITSELRSSLEEKGGGREEDSQQLARQCLLLIADLPTGGRFDTKILQAISAVFEGTTGIVEILVTFLSNGCPLVMPVIVVNGQPLPGQLEEDEDTEGTLVPVPPAIASSVAVTSLSRGDSLSNDALWPWESMRRQMTALPIVS